MGGDAFRGTMGTSSRRSALKGHPDPRTGLLAPDVEQGARHGVTPHRASTRDTLDRRTLSPSARPVGCSADVPTNERPRSGRANRSRGSATEPGARTHLNHDRGGAGRPRRTRRLRARAHRRRPGRGQALPLRPRGPQPLRHGVRTLFRAVRCTQDRVSDQPPGDSLGTAATGLVSAHVAPEGREVCEAEPDLSGIPALVPRPLRPGVWVESPAADTRSGLRPIPATSSGRIYSIRGRGVRHPSDQEAT